MKIGKSSIIEILIGIIIGLIAMCFFMTRSAYKVGQIDAINGNITYELVIQSDSTRTWEYIE